jgi:hypothetical protein
LTKPKLHFSDKKHIPAQVGEIVWDSRRIFAPPLKHIKEPQIITPYPCSSLPIMECLPDRYIKELSEILKLAADKVCCQCKKSLVSKSHENFFDNLSDTPKNTKIIFTIDPKLVSLRDNINLDEIVDFYNIHRGIIKNEIIKIGEQNLDSFEKFIVYTASASEIEKDTISILKEIDKFGVCEVYTLINILNKNCTYKSNNYCEMCNLFQNDEIIFYQFKNQIFKFSVKENTIIDLLFSQFLSVLEFDFNIEFHSDFLSLLSNLKNINLELESTVSKPTVFVYEKSWIKIIDTIFNKPKFDYQICDHYKEYNYSENPNLIVLQKLPPNLIFNNKEFSSKNKIYDFFGIKNSIINLILAAEYARNNNITKNVLEHLIKFYYFNRDILIKIPFYSTNLYQLFSSNLDDLSDFEILDNKLFSSIDTLSNLGIGVASLSESISKLTSPQVTRLKVLASIESDKKSKNLSNYLIRKKDFVDLTYTETKRYLDCIVALSSKYQKIYLLD